MYRNAARGGSSHSQRRIAYKICEDRSSGSRDMLANRQTARHTDRQTGHNTPLSYQGGVIIIIIMMMMIIIMRHNRTLCNSTTRAMVGNSFCGCALVRMSIVNPCPSLPAPLQSTPRRKLAVRVNVREQADYSCYMTVEQSAAKATTSQLATTITQSAVSVRRFAMPYNNPPLPLVTMFCGDAYLSGSSSTMKFSMETIAVPSSTSPLCRKLSMRSSAPRTPAE